MKDGSQKTDENIIILLRLVEHVIYGGMIRLMMKRRIAHTTVLKLERKPNKRLKKILIRRQLEDIARRLNKGVRLNWDKNEQSKYYIELYGNNIITNFFYAHKAQGTVYCLDENFIDVAIQEIGEERLKKYLRGE